MHLWVLLALYESLLFRWHGSLKDDNLGSILTLEGRLDALVALQDLSRRQDLPSPSCHVKSELRRLCLQCVLEEAEDKL